MARPELDPPKIDPPALVICRKASDYRKPAYLLGCFCRVCKEELQVSLMGQSAIEMGAIPVCNGCGFAIQQRLMKEGAPMTVVMSPEATAQLEEIAKEVERTSKC